MNRKGQTGGGPLQGIYIALILLAGVSIAGYTFLADLAVSNDVVFTNESSFKEFHKDFNDTQSQIVTLKDKLSDSSSAVDVVSVLLTNGFSTLLNILFQPIQIFESVMEPVFDILPIPEALRGVFLVAIMAIIIFAILALIMKVRA